MISLRRSGRVAYNSSAIDNVTSAARLRVVTASPPSFPGRRAFCLLAELRSRAPRQWDGLRRASRQYLRPPIWELGLSNGLTAWFCESLRQVEVPPPKAGATASHDIKSSGGDLRGCQLPNPQDWDRGSHPAVADSVTQRSKRYSIVRSDPMRQAVSVAAATR